MVCLRCMNHGKPNGCTLCGKRPRKKRKSLKEQRLEEKEKETEEWYKSLWEWRKVLGSGTGHKPLDDKVEERFNGEDSMESDTTPI